MLCYEKMSNFSQMALSQSLNETFSIMCSKFNNYVLNVLFSLKIHKFRSKFYNFVVNS